MFRGPLVLVRVQLRRPTFRWRLHLHMHWKIHGTLSYFCVQNVGLLRILLSISIDILKKNNTT